MARVLVIDDDLGAIDTLAPLIRLAGHECAAAQTGHDGILSAHDFHPDLAVIDLRLPDISGIDVLRHLRTEMPQVRCVLLTGYWDFCVEFSAIEVGALACVVKPLIGDDVIKMVERALAVSPTHTAKPDEDRFLYTGPIQPHDLARIADKVAAFTTSPEDRPTLRDFGRAVGVSVGGFRNWCHTAQLKANCVLRFARGLRATMRQQYSSSAAPSNLLKIVDSRTLRVFLTRCGGTADQLPSTVEEFFQRQQFINNANFTAAVRAALHEDRIAQPPRCDTLEARAADTVAPPRRLAVWAADSHRPQRGCRE